jgi:hypothetical protein
MTQISLGTVFSCDSLKVQRAIQHDGTFMMGNLTEPGRKSGDKIVVRAGIEK